MEAKELRIGNYVKSPSGNVIEIEDGLSLDFLKGYTSILLTEEWLVRLGAELKKIVGMGNEYNIELREVEISWDKLTGVTVFILGTLESFCVSYIEYVHQFQNFCFALTNKELTIK